MKTTLHQKVLLLVQERIAAGDKLQDLAPVAGVTYQCLWRWVNKRDTGRVRLNVDAVQNLYEHLTGKQLDY